MNRNHTSMRAKRYYHAGAAMAHYLVIERLPAGFKPSQPGSNWPAFLNEHFGDDASPAYEGDRTVRYDEPSPARPTGRDIDDALAWLNANPCNCAWMWTPKKRQEWEMFTSYSRGASVHGMADHYGISRFKAGEMLDSMFYQIQIEEISRRKFGKAG